ncbi:MAG: hypothetical protein ACUVRZ_07365 [Desulfobacca sp.]|uniref:hypothetical protein n=1 Tax=Desulfobacca sp. TaxID=2067990 RepID=UPI00404B1FF2
MKQGAKKKMLAIFTATGCRTCEHAMVDLHYEVNPLTRWAEVVFWPYLLGSAWEDLDSGVEIDICFFAGALRTADDLAAATRLRAKSQILVAVGACAAFGGLPGLANLVSAGQQTAPATAPRQEIPPLSPLLREVRALTDAVAVDYVVPGCPPTPNLLWAAFQALVARGEAPARLSYAMARLPAPLAEAVAAGVLPPRGSVFAGEKAVCATCSRVKEEKRFRRFLRPYQAYEESGRCLLEQGLICQGVATREGCGGLCTAAGIPCRGCFGKAPAIIDPGAKMVAAISSTLDSSDAKEIAHIVEDFVDLAGTFYRYLLPTQCLLRSKSMMVGKDEDHNP